MDLDFKKLIFTAFFCLGWVCGVVSWYYFFRTFSDRRWGIPAYFNPLWFLDDKNLSAEGRRNRDLALKWLLAAVVMFAPAFFVLWIFDI